MLCRNSKFLISLCLTTTLQRLRPKLYQKLNLALHQHHYDPTTPRSPPLPPAFLFMLDGHFCREGAGVGGGALRVLSRRGLMHWEPSYVFYWICYEISGSQVATEWTAAEHVPLLDQDAGPLYLPSLK